ncbi:MAG: transcriptional regulator [Roseateles depolymerans]|uniref:Transcriptional regulator n=1 Tax=Roseateles depolymerans TaxID=76731 RepID=A0A2W5DE91_9BURK|nr:MAG: transcriptional regulator [Roseateles depolymerans]
MAIAHTKIRPPRPRAGQLIQRPALLARLERALDAGQSLLLCAPAGFGKTALLSQWLAQLPGDVALAWVALDEGDDLARLLDCLFAALEPFDLPWRTAPEGLRDAALRGGDELLRVADVMLNTLDASDAPRGLIVLDDVHHLADAASLQFLDRWLARLGERWHLVLSARQEPALRLARRRASGGLVDVAATQLALDAMEVAQIAAALGQDTATAQRLFERSGGWPAGLRLALGGAGAGAIDRAAFDYLASEVLDRLEPGLQGFLLRCCVLYELDAARCEALGEPPQQAAHWLREIERQALFVTVVDVAPLTLRLHQLFRDMLRQRLQHEQPVLRAELLARAAALEADPGRRQGLLLAAGQPQRAAELLLAEAPVLISGIGAAALLELVQRFAPDFADASPELHRARAIALWRDWEAGRAHWHLEQAEQLYAARGDEPGLLATRVHRGVLLIAQGRLAETEQLLQEVDLSRLTGEALRTAQLVQIWHALETGHFNAVAGLFEQRLQALLQVPTVEAWYDGVPPPRQLCCLGMAPLAERWFAGSQVLRGERTLPLARMCQAWNLCWQGRLTESRDMLARAEADAAWVGQQVILRNHGLALRALHAMLAGDIGQALDLGRQRIAEHVPGYGAWALWQNLFFSARVAASCGAADLLQQLLDRLTRLAAELPDLVTEHRPAPLLALQGQLAWLQGRPDAALQAWREVLRHEEGHDLLGHGAETRLRLGAALLARGEPGDVDEALTLLVPALSRREPGGLLWAPALLAELGGRDWQAWLEPAAQARLRHWLAELGPPPEPPAAAPVDELLSGREAEVLAHIAAGASNKHIARALDISPHTVKRHVANILDKLALDSRGQAAAWWRERLPATGPGQLA